MVKQKGEKMTYLDKHKEEIFKKYTKEELLKDIYNYKNKKGKLTKVLNHFFEECIFNCCGKKTKISPMEVLKNDIYMQKILDYIKNKPNFFTSDNEVVNVKSCFRNSMSWVRKVANFCPRNAKNIYFRYFQNLDLSNINCLDTSMGFGSRMSAVLLNGANYYGIDPNKELFKKLEEYKNFLFNNSVVNKNQKCCLFCQGSEVFNEKLTNMMDVSFTSPPYFNLERYSEDDYGSTINYNNYDLWVKKFVYPTVLNTYKYLKVGGYAMINIKNLNKKECCFNDFMDAFNKIEGFEFVEIFDMDIPSKKQYGMAYKNKKGVINSKEPIMVFRKVK